MDEIPSWFYSNRLWYRKRKLTIYSGEILRAAGLGLDNNLVAYPLWVEINRDNLEHEEFFKIIDKTSKEMAWSLFDGRELHPTKEVYPTVYKHSIKDESLKNMGRQRTKYGWTDDDIWLGTIELPLQDKEDFDIWQFFGLCPDSISEYVIDYETYPVGFSVKERKP